MQEDYTAPTESYSSCHLQAKRLLAELETTINGLLENPFASDSISEKRENLREISRSINILEGKGVKVSDELRTIKAKIQMDLDSLDQENENLIDLAGKLEELATKITRFIEPSKTKRIASKTSKASGPKTQQAHYRPLIIEALRHNGGKANRAQVMEFIEKHMQGKFTTGDLERGKNGEFTWKSYVGFELNKMKQAAFVKRDSLQRIWELSETF
jgi:hypothetical protein